MTSLIHNFPHDGVITIDRVIAKPEFSPDDLQERVAELCENGSKEIAYDMLWSGAAYSPKEAVVAKLKLLRPKI